MGRMKELRYLASGEAEYDSQLPPYGDGHTTPHVPYPDCCATCDEALYDNADWWTLFQRRIMTNDADRTVIDLKDEVASLKLQLAWATYNWHAEYCWHDEAWSARDAKATCICAPRPDGYFVGHPDCIVHGTNAKAT